VFQGFHDQLHDFVAEIDFHGFHHRATLEAIWSLSPMSAEQSAAGERLRAVPRESQFRLLFASCDILSYVPAGASTVSSTGPDGIRHFGNVQAETRYEAVVLAIRALGEHECAPGAGGQLEVDARSLAVTHPVSMAKVQDWLRSSAKSPSDKIMKERLKGLLASQ